MRFVFVPFVILAASFSVVAAQTATVPPDIAPNKTDQMRPPPPPAPVNVLNFPEVQAVSGSVSVDNLPAVQTVGGTVNVGNLPLDAEGAVRVTGGCPTSPPLQAHYFDLLPQGPIVLGQYEEYSSVAIDARGYSRIGVNAAGAYVQVFIDWTWANISDLFSPVDDNRNGAKESACQDVSLPWSNTPGRVRFVCVVSGEQVRLRARGNTSTCPLSELSVYLIP